MSKLKSELNSQTAKIPWTELQRFFAQGRVWLVDQQQDLVQVAAAVADDQSAQLKIWQYDGTISQVTDLQASEWLASQASVWAVTVAPFVLVQLIHHEDD